MRYLIISHTTRSVGCYLNLPLLILDVYLTINPNFTYRQLVIFAQCDSHLSVNFDEEVWLVQESVNFIYFVSLKDCLSPHTI